LELNAMERIIILRQPQKLVFGNGCSEQVVEDFSRLGFSRVLIVTSDPILPLIRPLSDQLQNKGIVANVWDAGDSEPTIEMLEAGLETFRSIQADAVVGLGGGSVLDLAKLISALCDGEQKVKDVFGIDKLHGRSTYLACLPTTAGTGSEVSPNAILFDPSDQSKKGVVSQYLVPDAAYVDPLLTRTVPANVTAATGMDALVHCIEAYANRFAHAITDNYALEGIRLIAANLKKAYENGLDIEARSNLALASMYGGLCLGPVNTGAVHALAYPLGGKYHVPHGVSNAVLLRYVMRYNVQASPERYAEIAKALGAEKGRDDMETAQRGVDIICALSEQCGMPSKISELRIPYDDLEEMAESAMTVTRLLKNNLREITYKDALSIYRSAW
jgi:alcohol dehydrogenase class IV